MKILSITMVILKRILRKNIKLLLRFEPRFKRIVLKNKTLEVIDFITFSRNLLCENGRYFKNLIEEITTLQVCVEKSEAYCKLFHPP